MFFRYIGKSSRVISYGTILEQRDGLFEYNGYRFCCEKEKLQPLGGTLNCKALGYEVGDQFIVLMDDATYCAQGSTIELVEDDNSSIPWFKYVSGPKGEDERAVFAASLSGLLPLKGCGGSPVKTEEKPVKGPLYDAVFAVDKDAAELLPRVEERDCDVREQPSQWLRCGFLWQNTPQGREFWAEVHKKMIKAEAGRELWAEVHKKMIKAEADRKRLTQTLVGAQMYEAAETVPRYLKYDKQDFVKASDIMFACFSWGCNGKEQDFWQSTYKNLREIEQLAEQLKAKMHRILVENGQKEAAENLPLPIDTKACLERSLKEGPDLSTLFIWEDTQQGHDYWSCVNKKLKDVAQKISRHRKYRTRSGLKVRILCVDSGVKDFPVIGIVKGQDKTLVTFTADGKFYSATTDANPMDLIEDKDAPFEKDDIVLVSYDGHKWAKRHYDRFEDGKHYAYRFGASSETDSGVCETTAWPHVKRP